MEPTALFNLKDYIYLAGLGLTAGTFVWKLRTDTRLARYRETVAFIEKREKDMRERWKSITHGDLVGGDLEEALRVFVGQLELVSLLIQLEAFDSELVYNYWWRYFDEPLGNPDINSWVQLTQEQDAAMFRHYVLQCKRWATRLDVEIGRGKPKRWWQWRANVGATESD